MARSRKSDVTVVVGGQFGSEGKGVIVHHLANEYDVHVRTGGPNAGHSFNYNGQVYKMQVIPCGWTNPNAVLVLGIGMLVDPLQLKRELDTLLDNGHDLTGRLVIDMNAMLLEPHHHQYEGGIEGELHQRIGSTGEGVGAARAARLNRDPESIRSVAAGVEDYPWLAPFMHVDTVKMLHDFREQGHSILLEGTQGSGLSLVHGPWPYVTSADTNAAQLCADAGIPPHAVTQVIVVVRYNPIRVAGNSGPLHRELTWDEISARLGRPVEERTTVTNKIRRVGEWDEELVMKAVMLNGPTSFALTFADYIDSADAGVEDFAKLSEGTRAFVTYLERYYGVPVNFIGTGGDVWSVVDRRPDSAN